RALRTSRADVTGSRGADLGTRSEATRTGGIGPRIGAERRTALKSRTRGTNRTPCPRSGLRAKSGTKIDKVSRQQAGPRLLGLAVTAVPWADDVSEIPE